MVTLFSFTALMLSNPKVNYKTLEICWAHKLLNKNPRPSTLPFKHHYTPPPSLHYPTHPPSGVMILEAPFSFIYAFNTGHTQSNYAHTIIDAWKPLWKGNPSWQDTYLHPSIHQSRRHFLPFSHTSLSGFPYNYTFSLISPAATHTWHSPDHAPKIPLPLSFPHTFSLGRVIPALHIQARYFNFNFPGLYIRKNFYKRQWLPALCFRLF